MRGVLAQRNLERIARFLDVMQRLEAEARTHGDDEAVAARIRADDAQRQRLVEQSDSPIGLRQHRRGVDERHVDVAVGDRVRHDRRTRGQLERWLEIHARTRAHADAHVAVAAVLDLRLAGDVEAQLPQNLGALEVGALR